MLLRAFTLLVVLGLVPGALADELGILRMSLEHRQVLHDFLESTACDCGCGMTTGVCLRDDPACPVSPEIARAAIGQLFNAAASEDSAGSGGEAVDYVDSSQNGSVVSGQINGRNCTYASAGGTTVRLCD